MPKPWEINWLEKEISEYEKENNTQKFVKDIPKGKKPWEINWLDVELKASMGSRVVSTSDSKSLGDGLTLDTVFEGLKQAESGGTHIDAKTGKLKTSPAGAEGITQLMPKTAERPGYGIKPVQDKSEGEYLRVGKEYLAAMYKKYGDWEMSLAAYNAGSGSVDAAKGKAERFGGSWKDYLPKPKETLPYIDKILGRNPKGIVNATPDKISQGLTGKQALENVKGVAYDVASMLPVSGEAISAKEAYDKFKQGDLSGSALAAVGAIPLVGSVKRVGIGERFFKTPFDVKNGYASVLNNPIHLKDGTRLSGFTDAAQTTFHGYDKNGERITIRVDKLNPEDIVSSKDSSKTAEYIKNQLSVGVKGIDDNALTFAVDEQYKNLTPSSKAILKEWIESQGNGLTSLRKEAENSSKTYVELYKAGESVRKAIQEAYGETVMMFRGLRSEGALGDPVVQSFTLDKSIAKNFAGKNGRVVEKMINVEDIISAGSEPEKEFLIKMRN